MIIQVVCEEWEKKEAEAAIKAAGHTPIFVESASATAGPTIYSNHDPDYNWFKITRRLAGWVDTLAEIFPQD